MQYTKVKNLIVNKLRKELDPRLTYHSVFHTLDVIDSVERLSLTEHVTDIERILLKTAAVFHDSGFLSTYKGHEEISCQYAIQILPGYGYRMEDISKIQEMILATQIPQSPKSLLGELLCDADLDYLGRDDFEPIANRLFNELISFNLLKDEQQWNKIQLGFIENHHYFTKTAIRSRERKKQRNLDKIRDIVACYNV